jgi:hypothetical protein
LRFEPRLPDSLFERTLAARYPGVPDKTLFDASAQEN